MSTFLQLVNDARAEAGVAASDLLTLQSGLSTESNRFKNWVIREWKAIQSLRSDWQFLRQSGVMLTTANKSMYTPAEAGAASTPVFTAAQFGDWKRDSFRVFKDPAYTDEMLAGFIPWDQWRNLYQYGSMRTNSSRPVAISVAPDKSLCLGMVPDQVYSVVYEYYSAPVTLSADADIPAMPAQYHDLITYRALLAYGVFMAAPEVIARAQGEIGRVQPKLMANQLPIITSGPPLA